MGYSPALMDTLQHGAGNQSAEAMARVHVGGYEIKGVIGEGGTGAVYRGRHVASDRTVAIKILHDRGARQKEVVEQFIGEARATSRIRHPNVIEVTDLGTTPEGTVFLVMEYLEGESLRNRLHSVQHLPLFEAINILRQVARGLGAAHEAGIVHGCLKPADIFLCSRKGRRRIVRRSKAQGMRLVVEPEENFDLVKLLDFGMARFLDLAPGARAPAGAVSGTLHYLSPEQAQGEPTDQRSDIYSLGAVFYEMITGTVPFDGESLLDILRGHVSGQVIAPSRRTPGAGIHMRIDELILKCLKKNPNLRFVDTSELCEALDACITDRAFLRDAHRLPGIVESGIDLSEASPEAREDPARSAEKPAAAPGAAKSAVTSVAEEPAATSGAQKTAVAPAAEKPALVLPKPPAAVPVAAKPSAPSVTEKPATVLHKPAAVPVAAKAAVAPEAEKPTGPIVLHKPAAAPVAAKPAAASVAEKPAVVPAAAKPASFLRKPAAAPVAEKPAAFPLVAKSTAALFAEKPVAAPAVRVPAKTPTADDPAAAVLTPPPTMVAQADDPAAAVLTPPPTMVATADDPAAAVLTPPPAAVVMADDPASSVNTPPPAARAADLPAGFSVGSDGQPSRMNLARPEAIVPDADERPERFDRAPSSRRPWVMALASLLLLGAGIAVWAARSGLAPSSTKPVVTLQTAPAPTPAPAPLAAAPVPAVPAAPAAPVPPPSPPPLAAAPVVTPAAPAAAPAAALPRLEPAVPAAMARATARGPGKRASARIRHAQASRGSRTAPVIPAPSETETAPATELETAPAAEIETAPAAKPRPQPESEPPVPSIAPAEPKPSPPAPASADDLVREAQHAWMAGHYALAISKAQAALKAEPKHAQAVQAYEIIATSSCAIGQAGTAREAASHLSDTERELVRTMCKASGVTIE